MVQSKRGLLARAYILKTSAHNEAELLKTEVISMKATINQAGCISCGLCVGACPEVFRMSDEDGKAEVYADPVPPEFREDALNAEGACPVSVIEIL